jgi:ribose transport system substrate-binding protein
VRTFGTRAVATVVACAAVLGVAACGSDDESDSGGGETTAFEADREAGIPGGLLPDELALWEYDAETSEFVETDGDASQPYKPNLREPAEPISIAYDDGFGGIPFTVSIKENLERITDELGIELFYCDEQFKPEKAIDCAEQQVVKDPDFAIESNFQSGAAENVMNIWNEAGIPVANVDVWHPNGIFMGANNYESGRMAGRAAGEFAEEQWGCDDVWALYGENPGEGKVANERGSGFFDGVQEICGSLEDRQDTILLDAGSTDQAITKTTDWLTANPQAGHILATSIDDARAVGMQKAFVQNDRDGYAVGQGCDEIGVEAAKEGPPAETHFIGCVAFFPEKYPEYLVSIALDVLEGKPVPQEVHIEHEFLDNENVAGVYP